MQEWRNNNYCNTSATITPAEKASGRKLSPDLGSAAALAEASGA